MAMENIATNEFYLLGLILLFPLVGAAINGLFGRWFPKQVVWLVACGSIGLSFVVGLMSFTTMARQRELGRDPAVVEQIMQDARAAAVAMNAEVVGRDGKTLATQERAVDALSERTLAELMKAPRGYKAPKLEFTLFNWIVSGDWAATYEPPSNVEMSQSVKLAERRVGSDVVRADGDLVGVRGERFETKAPGVVQITGKLVASGSSFTSLKVRLGLAMDQLSGILVLIITGVGFLIHVYSIGYMRTDPSKFRYFAYLNLFCFSMLLLVLGSNLAVLFVGWEGVGLCSYLLIGYYYTDHANADAGKKAFIVNRIGDFAFILGTMTLFLLFGTLEFSELQEAVQQGLSSHVEWGMVTLACVLLFIGCTGKSAQLPLYVWLPDAMAGPTPVSALIHAATMVTAGVYLIARLNFLFIHSPVAMLIIASVGAVTAFYAATIALVQNDIKKVLAYSTVSQLGYMFLGVGVGAWWAAVFHLMTHAFFKALLFLGSGSVIDAMHHEQDIRNMGGLRKRMPVTSATFLIGCAAISGVPLLSGFFSKDGILWFAWFNQNPVFPAASWLLWALGVATAGLTAFYMFRLYYLTFEGDCRAPQATQDHISESPASMTVPLLVLAILSVIGGYIGVPHVLNFFHSLTLDTLPLWLQPILFAAPAHREMSGGAEAVAEWLLMGVSVAVAFGGIAVATTFYLKPSSIPGKLAERLAPLHKVLLNKYYVDEIYHATVVRGTLLVGKYAHAIIDRVLIDLLLVRVWGWIYQAVGQALRAFQNGDTQRYATYVVLGLLAMVYLVLS
jgi:NADH-quinone oxidoreductase subunit L